MCCWFHKEELFITYKIISLIQKPPWLSGYGSCHNFILFFWPGFKSQPRYACRVYLFSFLVILQDFLVIFVAKPCWYTLRRARQEEFMSKSCISFFWKHTDVYYGLYYGDTNAIYKNMPFFPEENVRQNVRGFSWWKYKGMQPAKKSPFGLKLHFKIFHSFQKSGLFQLDVLLIP